MDRETLEAQTKQYEMAEKQHFALMHQAIGAKSAVQTLLDLAPEKQAKPKPKK